MKHKLIIGLLIALFYIIPSHSQETFSFISYSQKRAIMKKANKKNASIQEYRDAGYYALSKGQNETGKRLLKMAIDKSKKVGDKYNRFTLKRERKGLSLRSENLYTKANLTTGDAIIEEEKKMFFKIKDKFIEQYDTLLAQAIPMYRKNSIYLVLERVKQRELDSLISSNLDLLKNKTEFETKEQYVTRRNKFYDLANVTVKKYDDQIRRMVKLPYNKVLGNCSWYKKELKSKLRDIEYVEKYVPQMKTYNKGLFESVNYDAEKQVFKISVRYTREDDRYKRYTNTYTIKVPQSEAQQFKEQKEHHEYFFMFKDLRAVVANGKTYKIEPVYRWYTRMLCDKKEEKAVLLVNNLPDTRDVKAYLKNMIISDATFKKAAKELYKSYLGDYTKNVKAAIGIRFDKNGIYKNFDLEYKQGDSFAPLNQDQYTKGDKQSSEKGDLRYSLKEIIKGFKIQPPMKRCEPQEFAVYFDYLLSEK